MTQAQGADLSAAERTLDAALAASISEHADALRRVSLSANGDAICVDLPPKTPCRALRARVSADAPNVERLQITYSEGPVELIQGRRWQLRTFILQSSVGPMNVSSGFISSRFGAWHRGDASDPPPKTQCHLTKVRPAAPGKPMRAEVIAVIALLGTHCNQGIEHITISRLQGM